jgi:hypothetical protein
LVSGSCRERGKPVAPMGREKPKWEDPMRVRVPRRGPGAESPVGARKVL